MSLLMKALEKAAKDRGEARADPAAVATAAATRPELSLALELLAADTPSPRMRDEGRAESTGGTAASAATYRGEAPRAAPAMRASQDTERSAGAYLRDHPLMVFGALAALFAIAFGGYVYLQIFHPGVFIRQQPAPAAPQRIVETPPSAPAAVQQIPTATLLQSAAAPSAPSISAALPQPAAVTPSAATPRTEADSPVPPAKPAVVRPAEKPEAPAPRNAIVVKKGDADPAVSPVLANAYAALQGGNVDGAAQLYTQVLRSEPKSIDALLGLAEIAVREGRHEDAAGHYRAILELDPRHALAQSGLIGLTGRADPGAAESHLKQLIAREPSAFLFFTLGNLYADQSLWAAAQQAYFQAHHLEPANPDYAYNLAVGLEHISQPRLALGFYRRAVELAAARAHSNFDPARARERIAVLASRVE
ncbi:MAG: tetratricopeptide repeat protein [Betaproteobacteria bacterium]